MYFYRHYISNKNFFRSLCLIAFLCELVLVTEMAKELESIMSNYVGIVRTDRRLKRAYDRLELIYLEHEELYRQSKITVPLCELRNMINVAYLIIKHARAQRENKGLHYNLDLIL